MSLAQAQQKLDELKTKLSDQEYLEMCNHFKGIFEEKEKKPYTIRYIYYEPAWCGVGIKCKDIVVQLSIKELKSIYTGTIDSSTSKLLNIPVKSRMDLTMRLPDNGKLIYRESIKNRIVSIEEVKLHN